MKDTDNSKQQLLVELAELRQHLAKLEQPRIERNRSEELVALQKTALEITEQHHLSYVLQGIVERATELLDARGGGLYLCEAEDKQVRCTVSYNTPHNYTGITLKYGEGAAGTVAETGKPLVIDDYRTWSERAGVFEDEQPFTAVLSTPMIWQGEVIGVIHVMDDVEARQFTQANLELLTLFANYAAIALQNAQAEVTLRESEERYRDLSDNAHDLIQSVLPDGKFLYVNRAWLKALGYAEAEVANLTLFDIIHPDSQEHCRREFQSVLTGEVVDNVEAIFVSKTGKRIPVEGSINCRLKDGKPVCTRGIFRDITKRKQMERALHKRVKELSCLYDISSLVESPGVSLEEILQGTAELIPPSWQYPEVTCARLTLQGKEYKTRNFRETTSRQSSDITVKGEPAGCVDVCYLEEKPESDDGPFLKEERLLINAIASRVGRIAERWQLEEKLVRMARHDLLTGVYNRHALDEFLERELTRSKRYNRPIGVLLIDVNRFKEVNDRFGHAMGDKVLQAVADILQHNVRDSDMVARYGGDEFLIVLPETNGETELVKERILAEVARRNKANPLLDFPVTLAIGSVHWSPDSGKSMQEALAEADRLMYESKEKQAGSNR